MSLASALHAASRAADEDAAVAAAAAAALARRRPSRDEEGNSMLAAAASGGASAAALLRGPSPRPPSRADSRASGSLRPRRHAPTLSAPSFHMAAVHPLAAQAAVAAASSGPRAGQAAAHAGSNLKQIDPHSIALLLEEARMAYQYGKHAEALTTYAYLESLKNVTVPNLGFHLGSCRRQVHQELLAIGTLTSQLKLNDQLGIHALGQNPSHRTTASSSLENSNQSSAASLLSVPNDPEHIAPSLVCEWERAQCWESLREADHARRSMAQLRRMMDTTSWPTDADNIYACWMSMAKWLVSHGYDESAKLVLDQARDSTRDEDASAAAAAQPYANDPQWLVLSAYVAWTLGEYESVAALAHYLTHTPQSVLAPLVTGEDGMRALEDAQLKMSLLHIGSCLSSDGGALSLDTAARLCDDILNHSHRHSPATLATTASFKANIFLLRGNLRQAVFAMKQAQTFEARVTEERAQLAPRFPFFGPLTLTSPANPLPRSSSLCVYDLRRSVDSWVARGTRAGMPPNFDVILASGGINPVHASSRHLSVLLDFYSELLLKYGVHDPRLLFYRSNLWAALGNSRMQLHDLEILLATSPSWFSQYTAGQTSCDWADMQSAHCPVSRVCVVNLLNLHLVVSCYGSSLMDKNVVSSAANITALQRKYYSYLTKISPNHQHQSGDDTAALSPRAHRRMGSTSVHDAEVASIGARVLHQRVPSAVSLPSRSSTSFSVRPGTVISSSPGVTITSSEWDSTPVSGLLPCEEPLYYEAIIADLTRQHASSIVVAVTSSATMAAAQESLENVLKQVQSITATAASAPESISMSTVLTTTALICSEGLALIHIHRLRFNAARHAALDGLARIWADIDHLVARKSERTRIQKAKFEAESKMKSSPSTRATTAKRSLTATQILASNAPFHVKALKLTAPLLAALADDSSLSGFDSGGTDEDNEHTIFSEASYWSSERSPDALHRSVSKGLGTTHTTLEWLEPTRLLLNSLRRHCAILLATLGISYMMEANTDTSLLLLYRALAIDSTEYFANLYLFYHHLRFSPLHLCIKHYITLYEEVPYFIPNCESINLSPLRYPLASDTAFSGSFADPARLQATESHNPFESSSRHTEPLESNGTVPPSRRPSNAGTTSSADSTLAYPFPQCAHRCLTTRMMDRPYTHTSNPEMSIYLQSLASHVQTIKHKNEISLKLHRQHELVEKWRVGVAGARKVDLDTVVNMVPPDGVTPLVLSLNTLHPAHALHPFQQRQKKTFEQELPVLKPVAPTKPPVVRSSKVKKDASAKPIVKKAPELKDVSVIINDPAVKLPPFIHVEHRAYQPSAASLAPPGAAHSWTPLHWYKESMKLMAAYDKSGVLFCFLKCLHLDIDYCASLNYVLSLLETNLTESNISFARAQMSRDTKEIDALEAAAGGSPVPETPRASAGGDGINKHSSKHSYESLATMFGRDKVLPIVWDIFIRGKQFEEYYGNVELGFCEYSYALMFMPLGDVLWRRGLIHKSRSHIPLALVDISEAIRSTLQDHSFLEKISAANPPPAKKPPPPEEIKQHMTDKEKKEIAAANALAANAHTPQASVTIIKQKLEVYHLVRALIFYNSANWTSAILDAKECLSLNSRNPAALRLLSLSETYLLKYDAALLHLERYLEVVPRDLGSRLRLANLYSFTQYHEKATKQFDKILSYAPTNVEVLYAKGLGYYRQHMWHDAHDLFQQCISLQPKFWLAYMRQGEVLERLESYDLAIETLRIAIAGSQAANAAPEEDTIESQSEGFVRLQSFHLDFIHRTLGRIYLSQAQHAYMGFLSGIEEERKTQAKRKKDSHMRGDSDVMGMESKVAEDPTRQLPKKDVWGDVLTVASVEAKATRAASAARADSIRAGRMTSEDVLAANLASATNNKNKTVAFVSKCLYQAFFSLQQAILETPGTEDPECFYLLAIALLFLAGNRLRDPSGKIWLLLERVIQLDPQHIEARFLRGFLLQREGRTDESTAEYDQALAMDPEHVLALQARAYQHFLAGERHRALDTYSKMLNHPGPLRAVAYANRGLVHLVNRNHYAALSDLDYAISAAPHHALAYLYRAESHKALAFTNEAILDYRTAVPMLKQKLDDAEAERKYMEARTGKRALPTSAQARAAAVNASGVAPTAFTFSPTALTGSKPSSSPYASLFTEDAEFKQTPTPTDSTTGRLDSSSPQPAHGRHDSSSSIHLALPPGSAIVAAPLTPVAAYAHSRATSIARWRNIRALIQRNLLRVSPQPTPLASPVILTDDGPGDSSVSPTAVVMTTPSPVPNSGSPYDMDSVQLHPMMSADHLRMVAHPLATSFASEAGLTQKDLDSVHNSLGILLHQRATGKKKAIIHAHGQKTLTAAETRQKMAGTASMTMTLAAQLSMVDTGDALATADVGSNAPPSATAIAAAVADAEDEEALSYFSTGSTQFQAHYNRALIFLEKGSLHTALVEFRHAVTAAPKFANAHNNYGVTLQRLGQLEEAAHHYTEALSLTNNQHLIAGFNLANTKTSSNQYQDAVRLYTRFLKRVQKMQREASQEKPKAVGSEAHAAPKGDQGTTTNNNPAMRFQSMHVAEHDGQGGKNAEFMPSFELDLVEHAQAQAREAEEKAAATARGRVPNSARSKQAADAKIKNRPPIQATEPVASLANQEDANLIALLPLALNNRAICFQNLGRNEDALAGYTAALALEPRLSYIKFNRAHLFMVMGNCFDALEDIREYSRNKAARNFQLEKGNRSTDARAAQTEQSQRNAIERDLLAPEGPEADGPDSPDRMEYLSGFYDYCKRYQWGLAVATKDLLTGIKCMPVLAHLNLTVPANPLALFNPHMLHEPESVDWIRLQDLLAKLTPDELLRSEYDEAVATGTTPTDPKLRAMFARTVQDSACVTHVKLALKLQVNQRFVECMDALLKAIYLLPPSPLYLEQQKLDFARRHNLSIELGVSKGEAASWIKDAPTVVAPSGMDPDRFTELTSDLHELLILWRARLQVYLGRYDDAVADLEFYKTMLPSADASQVYRGKDGRLRRNPAIVGNEDSDEETMIILPGGATVGSPSRHVSRPVSQAAHKREKSSASSISWRGHSQTNSISFGANVNYRTAEDEQLLANQAALYAHRQQLRHSRVLCYLGSLYHTKRRDTDALDVYTLAVTADRSNLYALLNRSLVSRLQGRYSNAIADLFEVLKIVLKLDEQQTQKDQDKKNGLSPPSTDPLWVSSTKLWQPELETGLPPSAVPKLRLTSAQRAVHTVLLQYGDVLKKNPQESWDTITVLQGSLAIAVDSVLSQRAAKKKKTVRITPGGGIVNVRPGDDESASSSSSSDGDSSSPSRRRKPGATIKMSSQNAAAYFRVQLDAATERLVDHLIDPKAAREKTDLAGSDTARSLTAPGPGRISSNLALVAASPTNAAPTANTQHLDASFTASFAAMQDLLTQQLPRKLQPTPSPRGVGGSGTATLTASRVTTTTTTTTTKTTFKLAHGSPASGDASHRFTFDGGDSTALPLIAANSAALASGQPPPINAIIPALPSPRAPQANPTPAGPGSASDMLISSLNARAKAALAEITSEPDASHSSLGSSRSGEKAHQPPPGKKGASGRSIVRGKVAAVVAAAPAPSQSKPPVAPRAARARAPTSAAGVSSEGDEDASFLAMLDPSVSAADRARLLEERRFARIAEVRHRFGSHGRTDSLGGLLQQQQQRLHTSSSLAALAASHAQALAQLEADEDECSSIDSDE